MVMNGLYIEVVDRGIRHFALSAKTPGSTS